MHSFLSRITILDIYYFGWGLGIFTTALLLSLRGLEFFQRRRISRVGGAR